MKSRIFWSVFFTFFLRLQIYKAIAAFFWQSASYVLTVNASVLCYSTRKKFNLSFSNITCSAFCDQIDESDS